MTMHDIKNIMLEINPQKIEKPDVFIAEFSNVLVRELESINKFGNAAAYRNTVNQFEKF